MPIVDTGNAAGVLEITALRQSLIIFYLFYFFFCARFPLVRQTLKYAHP
jgi:hypothetical protein